VSKYKQKHRNRWWFAEGKLGLLRKHTSTESAYFHFRCFSASLAYYSISKTDI